MILHMYLARRFALFFAIVLAVFFLLAGLADFAERVGKLKSPTITLGVWLPFAYALVAIIAINALEAKMIDIARQQGYALAPLLVPVFVTIIWAGALIVRFDYGHIFTKARPT